MMETVLSSILVGELFDVWYLALVIVAAVTVALALANTDFFLTKSVLATLDQYDNADLHPTGGDADGKTVKGHTLWERNGAVILVVRRPGCALCREEAALLSSLKPQLDELGVPLYAVVKEDIGTEIQDFKPYFKGEIFVDQMQIFYGPKHRRMGLGLGLVRFGVLRNLFQVKKKGYEGNRIGEGFILGGLYVIGVGKQGILLEHREKEFGDKADLSTILKAVKKTIKGQ